MDSGNGATGPLDTPVEGKCPACGIAALVVRDGKLLCTDSQCVAQDYAHETFQLPHLHVVRIVGPFDFDMAHPIRCRLGGHRLVDCPYWDRVVTECQSGAPVKPGTYEVLAPTDDHLAWRRLPEPTSP